MKLKGILTWFFIVLCTTLPPEERLGEPSCGGEVYFPFPDYLESWDKKRELMLSLPDLPRRLLNSAVIIVAISVILWFIDQPLVFGLLTVGLILLGTGGIREYGRITKVHLSPGLVPLLVACHTLILISFFISSTQRHLLFLPLFLLLLGGIVIGIYHFIYPDQAVAAVAQGFFGLCYISCPIGLFIYILHFAVPLTSMNVGRAWAIYLLVVTKITDIGAYLGGNLCGKRSLSPYLSPKKTIEGALSGMFCAMLASCGLVLCCEPLQLFLTIGESVMFGTLMGVLAQFGDLFESLLKRGAGIKDSGESQRLCRLLGPSGGVLDMIDSLLFTTPLVYLFLICFYQ